MKNNVATYRMELGIRIAETRKRAGYTQEELASKLGLQNSIVSAWEGGKRFPHISYIVALAQYLNCSLDWLLKGTVQTIDDIGYGNGFKWRYVPSVMPPHITNPEIERGVSLFKRVADPSFTIASLQKTEFEHDSVINKRRLLELVIRSRVIQIVDVESDVELAEKIKDHFKLYLKQCFVVKTSLPSISFVDHTLRTELVSFLAAHRIPETLTRNSSVGLTGGATLARFVNLVPPSFSVLQSINWLPLLVSSETEQAGSLEANSVVARMVYRQVGARGERLSFVDYLRRTPEYQMNSSDRYEKEFLNEARKVLNHARHVSTAIISIGSLDITTQSESQLPQLGDIYEAMSPEDQKRCIGNLLLYLVNEKCMPIDSVKEVNEAMVHSISLLDLKQIVEKDGDVWGIISRLQKAALLNAAIRTRHINNIVIDPTVAEALLRMK